MVSYFYGVCNAYRIIKIQEDGQLKLSGDIDDLNELLGLEGDNTIQNNQLYN